MFEEAIGRSPGDVSVADLPGVLELKKELCTAQVGYLEFVVLLTFFVPTVHNLNF